MASSAGLPESLEPASICLDSNHSTSFCLEGLVPKFLLPSSTLKIQAFA